MMADALPGLLLGTFVCVSLLAKWREATYAVLVVLGSFSVFVNSYQGLYNQAVLDWNIAINPDMHPRDVLDWHYPQFLHTADRERELRDTRRQQIVSPFEHKVVMRYDSPNVRFEGFSWPEDGFRWTDGHQSTISFELTGSEKLFGAISVEAYFDDTQRVTIKLNDHVILKDTYSSGVRTIAARFPPRIFRDGLNIVTFDMPDAHAVKTTDRRILGLSFSELSLG